MKAYKTGSRPEALFRINLNNIISKSKIDQGIGQNVPQVLKAKKADSPGPSPDQFVLAVVGTIFVIVGAFIFVWYTALKRNI